MPLFYALATWFVLIVAGAPEWAAVGLSIVVCLIVEMLERSHAFNSFEDDTAKRLKEKLAEDSPKIQMRPSFVVSAPEKRVDEFPPCQPWVGPEAEQYKEFKAELERASK